ncbi:hypothetical protein [Pyrobaculum neutrophilum]|uniref:Uncharacterized protein n=1 Tax=Pyrobaculum neutrophilum (strain DSM 2338 / JCM 9278 / NBRC 100436 / V24Sta) TaxID=444157 RepID=B1Y9J6_PYRNV|nr:hypothetical protein [Pyrobaculum neutrophilum]ACB40425.1 conserved hypothetical protein [Pyrobaculum neutrophilum V24Sta]
MIEKAVKRVVGVEDAPPWLVREVFKKVEEGLDIASAVNYLAPRLSEIHRANLAKFRPGRASIRKASPFLTAELIERLGYGVQFVELFGHTLPAAVRGERLYTPVVTIFDGKRKSLYLAAKSKRLRESVVQLTTTEEVEGVLAEVVTVDKPPYYYLYVSANVARLIDGSRPIQAEVNRRYGDLYYYWRYFRERGYLVLVGREIGGVAVDLLAVGLGKYAVVSGAGRRKVGRLRKVVDSVYVL